MTVNVADAIERYLLSTSQIHPLAARQARFFSRGVRDCCRRDDARIILLLCLAALQRGAPRADGAVLLRPIDEVVAKGGSFTKSPHLRDEQWFPSFQAVCAQRGAIADRVAAVINDPNFLTPLSGPLTSIQQNDAKPLLIVDSSSGLIGFSRYWKAALKLEEIFRLRLADCDPIDVTIAADILRSIFARESILPPLQRFHYRQAAAVALAMRSSFLIVSGGPGTGKTSVVIQILRALMRLFPGLDADRIVMCAPTGRAKARMTESLAAGLGALAALPTDSAWMRERIRDNSLSTITCKTIHSLLGIQPDGQPKFHAGNPLSAQLLVVDEASMVDIHLFALLMEAVSPHCRVVLVGDMHQLPPIEAGAVLGDLTQRFQSIPGCPTLTGQTATWIDAAIDGLELDGMDERESAVLNSDALCRTAANLADHTIILMHSYRCAAPIIELCSAVKAGQSAAAVRLLESRAAAGRDIELDESDPAQAIDRWLSACYLGEALETIRALHGIELDSASAAVADDVDAQMLFRRAFLLVYASRILTVVHDGPLGRIAINQRADRLLRLRLDPAVQSASPFFHGQQIILERNYHDLDLFNGDMGMVVRTANHGLRILFLCQHRYTLHPIERFSGLEPAYAITVHKAQGSEFDRVLLVLPQRHTPLLTRHIIYTAISRGRHKVNILGSRHHFLTAIETCEERPGGLRIP